MLVLNKYVRMVIAIIMFIASIFMAFAAPIYSIYNIVNTYKLDNNSHCCPV